MGMEWEWKECHKVQRDESWPHLNFKTKQPELLQLFGYFAVARSVTCLKRP